MIGLCSHCAHWLAWRVQPDHNAGRGAGLYGDCRHHAPIILNGPEGASYRTKWPSTNDHDFCGDFDPRRGPGTREQRAADHGARTTEV